VSLGVLAAESSTYKPNASARSRLLRTGHGWFRGHPRGGAGHLFEHSESPTYRLAPDGNSLCVVGLSAFLLLLSIGTLRRWRWLFWLILVAFLAGILRLAASVLQLEGILSPTGPAWFTLLQAGIGVVQFLIGLAMIAGYRRSGAWGAF
jgi:hypothetical protein